jgi:RHS repeat-associated protein
MRLFARHELLSQHHRWLPALVLAACLFAAGPGNAADAGFCPLPDPFPPTDPTDPLDPGGPGGDGPGGGDPGTGDPTTCSSGGSGMSIINNAPATGTGNPINLISGNKYSAQTDLPPLPGQLGLEFVRHYNSSLRRNFGLGVGWTHSYATSVQFNASIPMADLKALAVLQADGSVLRFEGAQFQDGKVTYRGVRPLDGALIRTATGFEWQWPTGRHFLFDAGGHLRQVQQGRRSLFLKRDAGGQLLSVTDHQNRRLSFAWEQGYLAAVTAPGGQKIEYRYTREGQLMRALGGVAGARHYRYMNPTSSALVTHIADDQGNVLQSMRYDADGRAVYSARADGVDAVSVVYGDADGDSRTVDVTNALGEVSQYRIAQFAGFERVVEVRGPGCTACSAGDMRYEYSERGQVRVATDKHGRTLRFEYDELGRELARYAADPDQPEVLLGRSRYEGASNRPVEISRPSIAPGQMQTYRIEYDEAGQAVRTTESGFAPRTPLNDAEGSSPGAGFVPISRSTQYQYDASGNVVLVDGPRADVADTIQLSYDSDNRLRSIIGPDGVPQNILAYDDQGRPTRTQVGSQTPTEVVYHASGKPAQIRRGALEVRYGYDRRGNLTEVTDPLGRTSQVRYDNADRATAIEMGAGRQTELDYDLDSRVVEKRILDHQGQVLDQARYLYDAQRRLTAISNDEDTLAELTDEPAGVTVAAGGQVARILGGFSPVDPEALDDGQVTAQSIAQVSQAMRSFRDARGNVTEYLTDDFGRIVAINSPESGRTLYHHDPAGNVVAYAMPGKDGAGWQITQRRYDGANRLLSSTQGTSVTRFRYDPETARLALAEHDAAIERFEHDAEGRLVAHHRQLDGHRFTTRYRYNEHSQLEVKELPGGDVLRYHYYDSDHSAGRTLRAVTQETLFGFGQETLIGEVDDRNVDGETSLRFGNGMAVRRVYDRQGRITRIETSAGLALQYSYDRNGNIAQTLRRAGTQSDEQYVAYDGFGRVAQILASVTSDNTPLQASRGFTFDHSGNRLSAPAAQSAVGVASDSNRLTHFNGAPVLYDERGNTLERTGRKGTLRYEYNDSNRPVALRIDDALVATYAYNAFGERIRKTRYADGEIVEVRYFLYDGHQLAAEADGRGKVLRQYVYHEQAPVAMLADGERYFVHGDALGTPQMVTDADGRVRWRARYDTFGAARVEQADIEFKLRFPGQYEDAESGTHYNYYRDYDPETGRYLTPDPIGLAGGTNVYAYANGNPLRYADPLGLDTADDFVANLEEIYGHAIDNPDKPTLADFYRQLSDRAVALNTAVNEISNEASAEALYQSLLAQGRSHPRGDLLYEAAARADDAADFARWVSAQRIFTNEVLGFLYSGASTYEDATFESTAFNRSVLNRLPRWIRDRLPDWCLGSAASIGSDTLLALGLRDPMLLSGLDGIAEYRDLLVGLGLDVNAYLRDDLRAIAEEGAADVLGSIPLVGALIAGGNVAGAIDALLREADASAPFDSNLAPLARAINAAVTAGEALERLVTKRIRRVGVGRRSILNHGDVGEAAVEAVFAAAQAAGLIQDSLAIQNASDQGIDLMVQLNTGEWVAIEVKTSRRSTMGRLDNRARRPNQRSGANAFTRSRLERARDQEGQWRNLDDATSDRAEEILDEIDARGGRVRGFVIHITSFHKRGQAVEFREWVSGNARGRAIPGARAP